MDADWLLSVIQASHLRQRLADMEAKMPPTKHETRDIYNPREEKREILAVGVCGRHFGLLSGLSLGQWLA